MKFNELGLSKSIQQALAHKGYDTPTPIQAQSIPLLLEGHDLLGIAQTGTGKTAAFMLPSIQHLADDDRDPAPRSCRMLVLAPTRELVGQIADNAREYGALSALRVASIVGGTSVNKDKQKLARGVDILVATPGRLEDLISQKALKLDSTQILVLDEADQMLDLGFIHALKRIVALLPKQRQTLLFSATMPKAIKQLASQYLTNPKQVSVAPAATTAERVDQFVCFLNQGEKQALLTMSIRKGMESEEMDRVLVFTRTKHGADRVVKKLGRMGIEANAIHGNKSQPQRERSLDAFRKGKVPILVATDIAARGIDIPGVSHVFNFELPNVPEQYVHRIGRTARAGASGVAIAFCAPDERDYLRDIQKLTGVTCTKVPLPSGVRAEVDAVEASATAPFRQEDGNRPEHNRPLGRKPKPSARPKPRHKRRGPEQGGSAQGQGGQGGGGNRNRNRRRKQRESVS